MIMDKNIELANGRLTHRLVEKYKKDGFLFPIGIFSQAEVDAFREELEAIEHAYASVKLPKPLSAYKRGPANAVIPLAARIAKDKAVLDVVESVLGGNILIWAAEFFIKEMKTENFVGMHQDLTYWGMGETSGQITAWIALSPSNMESGCMEFVRKSHKNKILPHDDTFSKKSLLSRGQEIQVDIPKSERIFAELNPGQMSLHHGLMIHGSGPNSSNDRRIGIAIRYINPDVVQQTPGKSYAMPARGVDNKGNFIHYPEPAKIFSEESLQIHQEICDSQHQVLMATAKQEGAGWSKPTS